MTRHEEIVFGVPMYVDPDMPPGQVARGLRGLVDTTARAAAAQPTGHPVTMPCPEGLDPAKWAQLDRKTRRALVRRHEKVQRRRG